MPRRKQPINPAREREIGKAVRCARVQLRYSQREFAGLLGLTRNQLANIESGRTPLTYAIALGLRDAFGVNLAALAGFSSAAHISNDVWPSLDSIEPQIGRACLFSEVAKEAPQDETSRFDRAVKRFPKAHLGRLHFLGQLQDACMGLMVTVPEKFVAEAGLLALEAIKGVASRFPPLPAGEAESLASELEGFSAHVSAGGGADVSSGESSHLTRITEKREIPDVHSEIANLIARVLRASAKAGRKAELARFLGVPQQRVSEWLSGNTRPGGETTLRLLQWVAAQERREQERPGGEPTPPGPKTRSRKPNEESQKPGPPKQ